MHEVEANLQVDEPSATGEDLQKVESRTTMERLSEVESSTAEERHQVEPSTAE